MTNHWLIENQDEIHARLFPIAPRTVLLTNSHIIVVFDRPQERAISSSTAELTLIQAFTPPADPHPAGSETGILRLSHEGIIPEHLANLVLIRNSTINSTSESTSLRFLRLQPKGDRLRFSCVDLTLPRSLSESVVPALIEVNDIFTVEGGIYDPFVPSHGYYIEASDDGHARGFCKIRVENDGVDSTWIMKFTVDASGDECVAAVGPASPPRWSHDDDPPFSSKHSFDGITGRFCYLKGGHNWRLHGFVGAEVVDIR